MTTNLLSVIEQQQKALEHCVDAIVERGLNGSPEQARKWGLQLPLERAYAALAAQSMLANPTPSTAGERDRTIVSLPIPASASDLKSDIAELIQSHKYKGLRSIEVLGVFQFLGAEIISGSNS